MSAVVTDAPGAARALLCDAFGGHRVRDDLVDAFAAWLPRCDFRLSAEFVAGWGLWWALKGLPADLQG